MTAVTFSPALTPAAKAAAKPQKTFWARVWDRIVEARMRQVEREIRIHLNYLPEETLKNYREIMRQKN